MKELNTASAKVIKNKAVQEMLPLPIYHQIVESSFKNSHEYKLVYGLQRFSVYHIGSTTNLK